MATNEVLLLLSGMTVQGTTVSETAYPADAAADAKRLGCAVADLILLRDVLVRTGARHVITLHLAIRRADVLAVGAPELRVPDTDAWLGA